VDVISRENEMSICKEYTEDKLILGKVEDYYRKLMKHLGRMKMEAARSYKTLVSYHNTTSVVIHDTST